MISLTRSTIGVVAAVIHELLKVDTFPNEGTLAEAIKARCASLRIPYDSGTVGAAMVLVGRTRPLVEPAPAQPRPSPGPAPAQPRPSTGLALGSPLNHEEAVQLLARLNASVRSMR